MGEHGFLNYFQGHRLELTFLKDPKWSCGAADLVVVLHDVSNRWTYHRLDPKLLELLYELDHDKHVVLVLNKVDLVKKKYRLLEILGNLTVNTIDNQPIPYYNGNSEEAAVEHGGTLGGGSSAGVFSGEPSLSSLSGEDQSEDEKSPFLKDDCVSLVEKYKHVVEDSLEPWKLRKRKTHYLTTPDWVSTKGFNRFRRVFMISSLTGDGVADLKNYIVSSAVPAPWRFHSQVTTDQEPGALVQQLVREKFLDRFRDEIPYTLKFGLKTWTEADGLLYIEVAVQPQKKHHAKYLIGPKGSFVKEIARETEQELMNLFQTDVKLVVRIEVPGGGKEEAEQKRHQLVSV